MTTATKQLQILQPNGNLEKRDIGADAANVDVRVNGSKTNLQNAVQNMTDSISVMEDKIAKLPPETLVFTNLTPSWSEESAPTFSEYPWKGTLTCPGVVTNKFVPLVGLSDSQLRTGIYSSVANSFEDKVCIYAKENPNTSAAIPYVICIKVYS